MAPKRTSHKELLQNMTNLCAKEVVYTCPTEYAPMTMPMTTNITAATRKITVRLPLFARSDQRT